LVENVVSEGGAEITDDHGLGPIAALLNLGEVVLHLVVHHQGDASVPVIAAIGQRQRGRRHQFVLGHREVESLQLGQRLVTGVGRGVGDEPERHAGLAQALDRVRGTLHRLLLHIEDPI